jgi:hypothetical protein
MYQQRRQARGAKKATANGRINGFDAVSHQLTNGTSNGPFNGPPNVGNHHPLAKPITSSNGGQRTPAGKQIDV